MYKTKICKFFMAGHCDRGDICTFKHPDADDECDDEQAKDKGKGKGCFKRTPGSF